MRYDHSIHLLVVIDIMLSIMMKIDIVMICSNKEEFSEYIFYYKSFLVSIHFAIGSKEISKLNVS